jgi:hypothetical protein
MLDRRKYLVFESGGRRLYADLDRVVTVLTEHNTTPVPESAPWLKGICATNGRPVYVLDLSDDYSTDIGSREIVVLRVKSLNLGLPANILPSLDIPADAAVEGENAIELVEDFIESQEIASIENVREVT